MACWDLVWYVLLKYRGLASVKRWHVGVWYGMFVSSWLRTVIGQERHVRVSYGMYFSSIEDCPGCGGLVGCVGFGNFPARGYVWVRYHLA